MAYGDIGAVIDTLEFDVADCGFPDIVHVSGDVYAIAYSGAAGAGWLVTVDIGTAGAIGAAVIDSFEFDAGQVSKPTIVHVSGDVFAIAYGGVDVDGFLVTVEITTAGAIGAAVIDSFEFDAVNCDAPDIIHVSGDVFAIVYQGVDADGWLVTVEITTDGAIGAAVIDTLEFDVTSCTTPDIVHVSGDVFAIVYRGPTNYGYLVTVEITTAGAIGAAAIDTLTFESVNCASPDIVNISGDIFAIVFQGEAFDGWLVTVEITTAGAIGAAIIDNFEFDAVACTDPSIARVSDTICAIVYQNAPNHGWLKTITIETDGQIAAAVIDTLEFDTVSGIAPVILHVSGDVYAIAYTGVDSDGFVITSDISTLPPAPSEIVHHEMLMGMGP